MIRAEVLQFAASTKIGHKKNGFCYVPIPPTSMNERLGIVHASVTRSKNAIPQETNATCVCYDEGNQVCFSVKDPAGWAMQHTDAQVLVLLQVSCPPRAAKHWHGRAICNQSQSLRQSLWFQPLRKGILITEYSSAYSALYQLYLKLYWITFLAWGCTH